MVKSQDWISQGWALVKPHLGTHILIALVTMLLSAVTIGIISGPLVCGWFMILLRQQRDPSYAPEFSDLWKGFEVFGQSFLAWLIIAIVAAIAGGLLGVVASVIEAVPIIGQLLAPMTGAILAICMMVVFLYVFPLIIDRRMEAIPALQLSAEKTTPDFIAYAGFALILYVINAVGAAICVVGSLITTPIVIASVAVAYADVLGTSGAAATARPEDTAEAETDPTHDTQNTTGPQ